MLTPDGWGERAEEVFIHTDNTEFSPGYYEGAGVYVIPPYCICIGKIFFVCFNLWLTGMHSGLARISGMKTSAKVNPFRQNA